MYEMIKINMRMHVSYEIRAKIQNASSIVLFTLNSKLF